MANGLVTGDYAQRAKEWREIEAEYTEAANSIRRGDPGRVVDPVNAQRMISENMEIARSAGKFAEMYEHAS